MEFIAELDGVDKDLDCMFVMWSTTKEEYKSTVAFAESIDRTVLNVSEWHGVEPLSAVSVVQLVPCNYRNSPLNGHCNGSIIASK